MRKLFVGVCLFLAAASSVWAAKMSEDFYDGYDSAKGMFVHCGTGRNVSEAVGDALSGLDSIIRSEIRARCQKFYPNFNEEDFDIIARFMGANIGKISKKIVRYAKNDYVFSGNRAYVVNYSIPASVFEEQLEEYMGLIDLKSDEMRQSSKEVVSINRFYKGVYVTPLQKITVEVN